MRFLIGLFLILIASPITLWGAESLNLVREFNQGELLTGAAEISSPVECPVIAGDCLYVHTQVEDFKTSEVILCEETLPENVKILEEVEPRCDAYDVCEDCYRVEKQEWVQNPGLTKTETAIFSVQGQEIEITVNDEYFGIQKEIVETELSRSTYTFLPVTEVTTVVRTEDGSFYVSNMNVEDTFTAVKELQDTMAWSFRVFSYVLMVLGFILFTSQFSGPIIGIVRAIPFLGGIINTGAQGVIYFLVAIVGTLVWLLLYVVIGLLANFVSLIDLIS